MRTRKKEAGELVHAAVTPPSATQWVGDGEPEAQSPGCRASGPWAAPPFALDYKDTGVVAARLRRASHGAAAWWHVGAQFDDERGTSLAPVDNGPRDGKTAANSSSSYRITQMNELVLGLNISSHMQFESSKGNTLNDQAHHLPQSSDHEQ
jgi:hypothetical protein